jgi:DUF1009 family protein
MSKKTLAIIAGAGPTPAKAVTAAKKAGHRVVAIAVEEAGAMKLSMADAQEKGSLLRAGSIVSHLENHRCDAVLIVGKFDKGLHNLDFSDMDEVTGAILSRLPGRADMDIGAVVLEELEARGFPAMSQLNAFAENIAKAGRLAGPALDGSRQSDIDRGLTVARTIAGLDIGQTIVIKEGLVIAVEAAEHSDRCIERAGRLVDGPKCVVKVARPNQDFRFDTPVVGIETLKAMKEAEADLLAIEAGRCLILDEDFNKVADDLSISVVGVS